MNISMDGGHQVGAAVESLNHFSGNVNIFVVDGRTNDRESLSLPSLQLRVTFKKKGKKRKKRPM